MPFKFEKLLVWQKALELSDYVHELSSVFPKSEMFNLTSQINRASDSISLDIAEGSTGRTNPEFKRFLNIALRSNIEVVACIHLAIRRKLISKEQFDKVYTACEEILVMINGLKNSLK
jgi:four helix bundle protein